MRFSLLIILFSLSFAAPAQLKWKNVDSLLGPLPSSVHIFFTNEKIDTGAFTAYYLIADLKDKRLKFSVDTSSNRRLTPQRFSERLGKPIAVVNCSFFSFETNKNLNVVIREGKILAYNNQSIIGRGKDTFTYRHPFGSAIGISRKRKPDIAWLETDSALKYPLASQVPLPFLKDSSASHTPAYYANHVFQKELGRGRDLFQPWKMETAVGGGPVLLQHGEIAISNNEELKFAGKALYDKHPRTAMGYTEGGQLIILVIQGRSESAGGANLVQEAQILKDLGCWEALNLDGGGSSCMLVNGQETIKPSDKEGERPVPAVFFLKAID